MDEHGTNDKLTIPMGFSWEFPNRFFVIAHLWHQATTTNLGESVALHNNAKMSLDMVVSTMSWLVSQQTKINTIVKHINIEDLN